jgi:hypothetical protein
MLGPPLQEGGKGHTVAWYGVHGDNELAVCNPPKTVFSHLINPATI